MQDCKSLRITVIICATLVNTDTHRQLSTDYIVSLDSYLSYKLVVVVDDISVIAITTAIHCSCFNC